MSLFTLLQHFDNFTPHYHLILPLSPELPQSTTLSPQINTIYHIINTISPKLPDITTISAKLPDFTTKTGEV